MPRVHHILNYTVFSGITGAFSFSFYFPVALVGSLALVGSGVYSMFVAKVYNRIGVVKTGTIGTLLCVASLLLTSQGTSVYFLMFSYGVIYGIASCFIYLPLFLIIPRYFDKRGSLALGLAGVGPGAGLIVMSPVSQALLDALGWRGTFMAFAGIVAIICPLLCVFQRMPDDRHSQQNNPDVKDAKLCDFSVFTNKRYLIYTVATCLWYTGHYIPSVHLVSLLAWNHVVNSVNKTSVALEVYELCTWMYTRLQERP